MWETPFLRILFLKLSEGDCLWNHRYPKELHVAPKSGFVIVANSYILFEYPYHHAAVQEWKVVKKRLQAINPLLKYNATQC